MIPATTNAPRDDAERDIHAGAVLIRSALEQWDDTASEDDLARLIWMCRRLCGVLDRMDGRGQR